MSKIVTNKIINPSVPTDVISGEIVDHIKGEQVGQITSNVKVLTKLFGQPVRHFLSKKTREERNELKTTHSWNLRFFFSEIVDNTETIALMESQIETIEKEIKRLEKQEGVLESRLNLISHQNQLIEKETVLEQKQIQEVHQTQIDVEIYDYNNIVEVGRDKGKNTFLTSDEWPSFWSVGISLEEVTGILEFSNKSQERINIIVKTIKDLIRDCIESIDNNNESIDSQITSKQKIRPNYNDGISEKAKTESIGNLYKRFITDFGIPLDFHFDNGDCWWVRQFKSYNSDLTNKQRNFTVDKLELLD